MASSFLISRTSRPIRQELPWRPCSGKEPKAHLTPTNLTALLWVLRARARQHWSRPAWFAQQSPGLLHTAARMTKTWFSPASSGDAAAPSNSAGREREPTQPTTTTWAAREAKRDQRDKHSLPHLCRNPGQPPPQGSFHPRGLETPPNSASPGPPGNCRSAWPGPPRPRSRRLGFPEVPRLRPASSSQAPPGGARQRDSSSRRPARHVPGGRTARNGGG